MTIKIFDIPEQEQRLKRIGTTRKAVGEYEASFYDFGRFTITVNAFEPVVKNLLVNRIINIDGKYWGIIKNRKIQRGQNNSVTVSGIQLKGLLWQRLTLPLDLAPQNAPAGFDSRAGSTEDLIKYFAGQNTSSKNRIIENLFIEPNQSRGNTNDKYYTRFEVLGDVISKIARRSSLGWDIVADENSGRLTLLVQEGLDRTINQNARPRAVFDISRGTLSDFEFTHETENAANVFYSTKSGAEFEDEALTQTYTLDNGIYTGLRRSERHLNISVSDDDDLFAEMEGNARKEMEGYRENVTIACTATQRIKLYEDYNNGDFATFRSLPDGIQADRQITAVKTVISEANIKNIITMGETRLNKFDYIQREIKNR